MSDVSSDKEEEEDCPNVVIAQFEKVSRTKNRWKCQLKDGIITIDLYNNKIIQKELDDDSEELEKEFNEFCRAHMLSV